MSAPKIFSFDEVSKHSSKTDCWMVVHGKVYDVTAFLEEHPGGEEVMLEQGGKDATEAFEDIGHSESARQTLAKYIIGEVEAGSKPAPPPKKAASGGFFGWFSGSK
ncbi:cytochrome b5-like protein [Zopfochytrium polystomum]|nr:cytochrome b5-like protein [Zopfochytrium polystomum]